MARRKVINGRYELQQEPLARGGMGEVWLGHDTTLDREIAVKFVRFHSTTPDEELVKRFVRESRITARLQHPGVPAVYDVGTEDGSPYLVMQRVHGMTVSDLLAQHERLSIGWAAGIAAQVCSVLATAHNEALVHRDLKPANVMLEPDGTIKVLDFGLAVALGMGDTSRITRTGDSIGTPAYMAPEQVLAGMTDPRTDLYCLGCSLYEMVTGERLFSGATSYSVMNKQVTEPAPSARQQRDDVPAELDQLLTALLEKKPEDRPDSAATVYDRLLPYAVELGPLPGVLNPPETPSPVRMYATVVSRTFDTRRQDEAPTTEPAPEPAPQPTQTRRAPISRSTLDRIRAEAGDLATQARYKEAAEQLDALVDEALEAFGTHDPDVMNTRLEWANILFEGGDYHAAAPAFQALADDLAERDGRDAELVFRCRNQFITCHARLGNTSTALETAQDLLADELRVYGPRDPRTLELRRQIGTWQLGTGQVDEARETLEALLADLLNAYGESHPAVEKVRELLSGQPAE